MRFFISKKLIVSTLAFATTVFSMDDFEIISMEKKQPTFNTITMHDEKEVEISLPTDPSKFSKNDFLNLVASKSYQENAHLNLLSLNTTPTEKTPLHTKSMSRASSSSDPWYIKDARTLITGKTLCISGVLLFKSGGLDGKLITRLTYPKNEHNGQMWSHSGILLKDKEGVEYCFESTGAPGQILHGMWPQVQIHHLMDVVNSYGGDVGVRYLNQGEKFTQDVDRVTNLVWDWVGTPYEKRPLELLKSIVHANNFDESSQKSLFCSEMTALLLQLTGFLPYGPKESPASNFLPRDFGLDTFTMLYGDIDQVQKLKTYVPSSCCIIL